MRTPRLTVVFALMLVTTAALAPCGAAAEPPAQAKWRRPADNE
jgi:hypothetical protein